MVETDSPPYGNPNNQVINEDTRSLKLIDIRKYRLYRPDKE